VPSVDQFQRWLRLEIYFYGRRRSMCYCAELENFAIRDHNQEIQREVSRLSLEKRLRDQRQPWSSRAFTFVFRRLMPLPR
jgi:hypothetical protein